jgi:hypothetical protein
VLLSERAEQRELLQRGALLRPPAGQLLLAVQRPEQVQRGQLGGQHRITRDAVRLGLRPEGVDRGTHLGRGGFVLRDVLQAQVDHRAEAAAGRRVRRGVDRRHRRLGVQRVEQHGAGAVGDRPLQHGAQVGVVAHRPGPLAAQRVELHHPAPGAGQPRGQLQPVGGDAQDALGGAVPRRGAQPVPAVRQVGQRDGAAQHAVAGRSGRARDRHRDGGAVLELGDQLQLRGGLGVQQDLAADPATGTAQDDRRRQQPSPWCGLHLGERRRDGPRRARVDVHRRERRGHGGRRDLHRAVRPVEVAGGHAVGLCELLQVRGHGPPLPAWSGITRGAITTARGAGPTRAARPRAAR